MAHEAKNYDHLLGKLDGLSESQLKQHFGLYQGYVKKLNEIEQALQTTDPSQGNYSYNSFSELKRREAVAFNGSFLHELYFENLAPPGQKPGSTSTSHFNKAFGSMDKWIANLRGTAASTPGWVLTTYSHVDNLLHTYVLYEHHIGLPVHQEIVLALDCWEHAYMVDYGTAKAKYLDSFLSNIHWGVVDERLDKILSGTTSDACALPGK